jgi:enoyl-CoA hydratase
MPGTVEVEPASPHVTIVRLNRPHRLNALSFELVADLHDALDTVSADEECKVAVLTGAGRAFCAGLDLADWGEPPKPGEHPHMQRGVSGQSFMSNLVAHIRRISPIVVAAVNGPAFGGGLGLACAADVRIAARGSRWCSAYIRTGLTGTDIGISYNLTRLIGAARAFDLIVSGREIDGAEAERIGLASQVVDDERLLDATLDYANILAGYTHTGLSMTKQAFWLNVDAPSLDAALAIEDRNQMIAGQAADVQDYMNAYRAKITKK